MGIKSLHKSIEPEYLLNTSKNVDDEDIKFIAGLALKNAKYQPTQKESLLSSLLD